MARVNPRISVIIPTLNEVEGIADTLRPLQAWRRAGDEVIVADGGSRDGTKKQSQGLIDRWVPAPRGRAVQMNAGAEKARGELLLFLHADTRLPGSARALLLQVEREVRIWGRFDVRLSGQAGMLRLVETLMNIRSRWTGIATGDQAMFVRRDVFTALGGFPDQPLMEDVELSKRLKHIAAPVCVRQRAITDSRRWEEQGIWTTIRLMWRLRWAYWRGVPANELVARYYPDHA